MNINKSLARVNKNCNHNLISSITLQMIKSDRFWHELSSHFFSLSEWGLLSSCREFSSSLEITFVTLDNFPYQLAKPPSQLVIHKFIASSVIWINIIDLNSLLFVITVAKHLSVWYLMDSHLTLASRKCKLWNPGSKSNRWNFQLDATKIDQPS